MTQGKTVHGGRSSKSSKSKCGDKEFFPSHMLHCQLSTHAICAPSFSTPQDVYKVRTLTSCELSSKLTK